MARIGGTQAQTTKRSRIITWVSGIAALAMVGTIAVVSSGYDARETPREEPSVWAMRSSGQYARVNTLTAEIDTVRKVEDPSGIVQAGANSLVLTHGNGRVWSVDPTLPRDLVEQGAGAVPAGAADETADETAADDAAKNADAEGKDAAPVSNNEAGAGDSSMRLPDGTRDVIVAGNEMLVRTESGEVYVGALESGADASAGSASVVDLQLIDPFADEEVDSADPEAKKRKFVADAAAIDSEGRVALASVADHEIRWYSTERGEFSKVETLPEEITADELQLAIVGGDWVALNGADLWRSGSKQPVQLSVDATAKLQASSLKADGDDLLVADAEGLWNVVGDKAERIVDSAGIPATPIAQRGKRYAAWIGQGSAQMWESSSDKADKTQQAGKLVTLDLDDSVKMPGDPEPAFRANGTAALLTEVKTGMMWTVPEGRLIPVEQWTLADPPKERDGTVVVADVTEQEPPVAVDDAFGVRATEPAAIPVLLNDFDPNRKDVLTIVPEGLGGGLDPEFGAISMMPNGQSLVFTPGPAAEGSGSFTYRITDGVGQSELATVSLTVVPDDVNSAPQWCLVEGCQREWPSPELAPGGTLVMPLLEGWVDPEGDPTVLQSATAVDVEAPVRALVTADGRLAVRHLDPNAEGGDVVVRVEVADARGETTVKDLVIQVRTNAKTELSPIAATVEIEQPATIRPLARVTGGSGSYTLADASVLSGEAQVSIGAGGTVEVRAASAGETLVTLTVRDSGTQQETTGLLRVTAVAAHAKLGLPPMRAFVRPLADTTVDVLDAIPGANSRALVVQGAKPIDGELRADVIEYASVRVSGSTPDGAPGRIGSVEVTVAEGADTAVGRLSVFQVSDQGDTGVIAVADTATVRAGAVADIRVLDNDVSAPGQRLVLHPEISGSEAKGELAFASGNTMRYLAPEEPGNYTVSYTTYGASSPEASDVGQVLITVLPREGNRNPVPAPLTVRMAPGEASSVQVPLSGVDPDGDRVRLVDVAPPADAQLTASLSSRSSSIRVEASTNAKAGVQRVDYTVRDEFGGEATGTLRIIVTATSAGSGAPITYSDYVRLVTGAKDAAVINPLENDLDPSGGTLSLVEVVPNVPGGKDSAEYRALADRLDTAELKKGRVSIKSSDEPGTVSYRYTVRSSESSSTADGLIVVQVSARVGNQAPTVVDTVLSARDRAELEGGGVDVVTDRVFWATGDASTLKLSVWGAAAKKFTVKDNRISGAYSAEGDLVPFKLAGADASGNEVATYGFLVIPPLDELRLSLVPDLTPLKVDEEKSRDVDLSEIVDLGAGDSAEFKVGAFPTQRGQGSCEATSKTGLRYSAGKGEPWTDSCLVSVKLSEQKTWTQLSVPVVIVPKSPVAELEQLLRTVAPGSSEMINLMDMVRWHGDREGRPADLKFTVAGGGGSFEVSPSGSEVTVTARADARPGSEDPMTVSVSGAGDSQAPLTLRVGEAAKDSPKGATVQLNCTVGSACQTQLVGAPGEYDPFKGKSGGGLKLEAIDGGTCAAYGTLQLSGDGVSVGWPNGATGAGGTCTASYTVKDAQQRVGTGTIELDAKGVPRPPVGVTPTDAGASTVTLSVALSSETSYPATTGVELVTGTGGAVGSCELKGGQASCKVSGLTPGEKRTYFARSVNSVGPSEQSANGAETWSYEPPKPPTISADTVEWPDNTDPGSGKIRVAIGKSSAASVLLKIGGEETAVSGDNQYVRPASKSHTVSVISVDDIGLIPPAYSGGDGGRGTENSTSVTPIGAPRPGTGKLESTGDNHTGWTISTSGWDANGGGTLAMSYGVGLAAAGATCSGSSSSGSGLTPYESYVGVACASTPYGKAGPVSVEGTIITGKKLGQVNGTYVVEKSPSSVSSVSAIWGVGTPSWNDPQPVGAVSYTPPTPGQHTVYDVVQCPAGSAGAERCSEPGTLKPSGLTPFELHRASGACVPWVSATEPPSDATLAGAFTKIGEAGGSFTVSQDANNKKDVNVTWDGGTRDTTTFPGVICEAPAVPDPDPDAGTDPDPGP